MGILSHLYPQEPLAYMVRLATLPNKAIIDGFKGVIDFYQWKGIACARRWPRWKPRTPTPIEATNQQHFAYINRLWSSLPANLKDAYNAMAAPSVYTGKDVLVIAYMKGIDYGQE